MTIFPTSPPIDGHLIDFRMPPMTRQTLGNGLKLVVIPDKEIPKVNFRLGLPAGEIHDPQGHSGAMELLSRVMKKGPQGLSAAAFSENVERLGGFLNCAAGSDFFYVYGDFLREYAEEGLKMLAAVCRQPALEADEFRKEQVKLIEDLENEKSSPAYLAQKELASRVYGRHPYGVFKDLASIEKIDPALISRLHRQLFGPDQAVLVIAGDIETDTARQLAESCFGDWKPVGRFEAQENRVKSRRPRHVSLIERPGSQQVSLALGLPLFSRLHPDFEKVQIANHLLGGGSSSKLFRILREEKGYTYGAYSYLDTYVLGGAWIASAEVGSDKAAVALQTTLDIIEQLRISVVTEEELTSATRYKAGSFPVKYETVGSFARLVIGQSLMGLAEDYWESHIRRLGKVSAKEVRSMFVQYLNPSDLQIVAVGDPEIAASLQEFGDLTVRSVAEAGRSNS